MMMIMLSEMMQFLIIIPHHPIMFGLICQNVKISRTEGGSMYKVPILCSTQDWLLKQFMSIDSV